MSRSRRKNLILTDGYGGKARKLAKHRANRSVRKAKDISNGKAYKKEYETYNIIDWKFHYTGKGPMPLYKWRRK